MKQTRFELKNKLNVLLIESKKSPVVSVQMWVKNGSADEKKSEEGISHFIEHLVFKGTDKYKVGEIANVVEASGGELNAYTSFDQTVFYVTISKEFTNVALDVVSQMMGYPTFDAAEIDSEREVVCEEIKMGQDSPGRRSSQLLFSSVFKKHPYGLPVIGYEKNVRSWPAKKIKEYYQSRYVPTNMFLVISGDFETKEMKQKVQNFFGGFKNYKLRKVKRAKEPVQKQFQYQVEKYKIQDKHLHLAFKVPSIKHKDIPALDVLAMILGQGDSSILVKKLRLEKAVVSSVSAFSYNPQDQGLFAISAQYQGEQFNEIVTEICKQINILQNSEALWQDIKRARIAISSEQFYSVETVDGLANKAGTLEFYFKDQQAQNKYLKKLNQIKPKDIQAVAKKYLKLNQLSASFLGNVDQKKSEKDILSIKKIWAENVFSKKIKTSINKKLIIPTLTMKAIKIQKKNEIEKIQLDSGINIIFKTVNDTPTVSAKFVFRGGARLETEETMGLTELATRIWIGETKTKTEHQVLQEIEESAIGLSAFSGKNTTGFSLDYLSAFEEKALNLTLDSVLNATFSNEMMMREKEILLQTIKSKEDHPSSLCGRQFLKTIFGNHPLSFEATGTAKSLTNINQQHILEFKDKVLLNKNLTVVVVGDYNKKTWINNIKKLEKNFGSSNVKKTEHAVNAITKNQYKFLESSKEQTHLIIGWKGLTLSDPDRYTLHVIEAVLAGQGGRLFYELRDKSSLAYSVSPMRMESIETGYFGGYIACSHEKVEKSIEMFQQEFKKLTQEKISTDELARAQKYLTGQHDIGLQRKASLCNLIAFDEVYGNDFNQSLNIASEYQKITQEKIIELSKKLFTQPTVISVVGKKPV